MPRGTANSAAASNAEGTSTAAAPVEEPSLTTILAAIQSGNEALKTSVGEVATQLAGHTDRFSSIEDRLASLEARPITTSGPVTSSEAQVGTADVSFATEGGAPAGGVSVADVAPVPPHDTSGGNWWDTTFRERRQDGRGATRTSQPPPARQDHSGPEQGAYIAPPTIPSVPSAPPVSKLLTCKSDSLGSFDGNPAELEDFLGRVLDIARMRPSEEWRLAIRAAIPAALKGPAAKWHKSLPNNEIAAMATLDDYFRVMRDAFPVNFSDLQRLAHSRRWKPLIETAMAYSFDKVALLRQVYGNNTDENLLVAQTMEGLEASFRAILRVPRKNATVSAMRVELGDQEPIWRDVHGIHIADSTSDNPPAPNVSASASTSSPPRRSSSAAIAPKEPRRPRGKPISEDFDGSRLAMGIEPKSKQRMMRYGVPGTDITMWCQRPCGKCGGNHFDFAHDFCSSHTVPAVNTLGVDIADYIISTD